MEVEWSLRRGLKERFKGDYVLYGLLLKKDEAYFYFTGYIYNNFNYISFRIINRSGGWML